MPQRIKVKKSSLVGKSPDAADLQVAELALNVADRKLFSKDVDGNVFEINPTAPAGYWEEDSSSSEIKNIDEVTKINLNGNVHTNANLDINSGNYSLRLFPTNSNVGAYTLVGANNSYGTFSIGTATTSGSSAWNKLVRFMVDANGKTIVGNDDPNSPPVAEADAELTVKGNIAAAGFRIDLLPILP